MDENKVVTLDNLAVFKQKFDGNISNPNLLDNPDFKVNQRGLNEYVGTSSKFYTVDRWIMQFHGIVSTDSSGITITVGDVSEGDGGLFGTLIDSMNYAENFQGKIATLSIYVEDMSEGAVFTSYMAGNNSAHILKKGLNTITKTLTSNRWIGILGFASLPKGYYIKLKWMKLELGTIATTFVPPNPTIELLKCQRYYQIRSTGDIKAVDLRPAMRSTPTITKLDNGNYAYTADL